MQHVGPRFPDQGLNLSPVHLEAQNLNHRITKEAPTSSKNNLSKTEPWIQCAWDSFFPKF